MPDDPSKDIIIDALNTLGTLEEKVVAALSEGKTEEEKQQIASIVYTADTVVTEAVAVAGVAGYTALEGAVGVVVGGVAGAVVGVPEVGAVVGGIAGAADGAKTSLSIMSEWQSEHLADSQQKLETAGGKNYIGEALQSLREQFDISLSEQDAGGTLSPCTATDPTAAVETDKGR